MKTKKARRRINLADVTLRALHEHRKAMLAEWHADAPVFCDVDGGYFRKSNFQRRSFRPALERAGLEPVRFHDLRHTCATLLLLAEMNIKVVSERLGHSTVTLSLDTYSHVLPTMQKAAAKRIGGFLGG